MEPKRILAKRVNAFTPPDLFRKAGAHTRLRGLHPVSYDERALHSDTIKDYILSQELLAILEKHGIKQQPRPDMGGRIFTIIDHNTPSGDNYWNFQVRDRRYTKQEEKRFNLRISLSAELRINEEDGVVLTPRASGTFLWPSDNLPHLHMFRALVESNKRAPAIAKKLAASDGSITIAWEDLGLGGILTLAKLFKNFAGESETVARLCADENVLDPVPKPRYQKYGDRLFVSASIQPDIIRVWKEQLEQYQEALAI